MKNKEPRKYKDNLAAIQFMTMDILKNIMLYSDNPGKMGEYLTRQIRELIGARVVILLESPNEIKDSRYRVISVQPARYEKVSESHEIQILASYCHNNLKSSVWRIGDSPAEVEEILSSLGYQTSITIPLLIGTQCVGVLLALDLLDTFAMDKVIQVLEPLSGVAALILRNALLYETQEAVIEERTHQLSIRNQITSVFLTIPDSEMYVEVLNVILAAMESKCGIFGYIDRDGALVCPSLTRDVWDQCRIPAKDIVFPREKWGGIWGRALVEKKNLYSNVPFHVLEGHIPITRALDVPIIHQEEVIGNILVGNKEKDYTDKDAELLEAIANHIAPILNARLQRDISENERQQADEKVRQQLDELERSRLALLGILEDARRSEEALKESEIRLKESQQIARIGQWELDIMNNHLYWSDGIYNLFEIDPDTFDASDEAFINAIHPDDRDFVNKAYTASLKNKTPYDIIHRLLLKDGTIKYVNEICRTEYDKDENAIRSIGTVQDITELKQAEEELRRHRDHLEEMVKERTKEIEAFSYSVSHDLRAPLRAISGFSEILSEDYKDKLDEEANRLINVIRKNTQDMNQLITDLLDFSRIGRQQVKMVTIDMKDLARDVFDKLSQVYPKRNIKFEIRDIPDAFGDRSLVRLVFLNMISNAIKFTGPRKIAEIEIGFMEKNKQPQYYVKDNGVGFDMKYVDKIFGVFQRLHSPEEFEGTGVGLAIVQKIIHKHGGKVTVEGEVEKGATFYFSLPKE